MNHEGMNKLFHAINKIEKGRINETKHCNHFVTFGLLNYKCFVASIDVDMPFKQFPHSVFLVGFGLCFERFPMLSAEM